MILGIGNDVIDIGRIEEILEHHGDRFTRRCFTEAEIRLAEERGRAGTRASTYAKRFAAKEACAKALGTGFRDGIYLKDIGVVQAADGRPRLELEGGARRQLETLVPAGMTPRLHVSLSDEAPIASALVIIEAVN